MKKLLLIICCCFVERGLSQPVITSITPAYTAPYGGTITILGSGFDPVPSNNTVFVGSVKATVSTASAGSITLNVPGGSTYDYVSVTVNNLTAYSPLAFCPSYTGAGVINANSFETKVDYATSSYPRYIIAKDLNDDGRPDITVVNNVANSLSVFKNNSSSGVFSVSPKVDYNTGVNPMQATSGDIDGDGRPDIIVGNYGSSDNTMFIFRNISSGGSIDLAAPVSFPTGVNPRFTVVDDINADGKPDLVVVNNNGYSVSVFKNTSTVGSISLAPRIDYPLGTWPMPVAIADIDGDGKPDIIAGDYNDNVVSVLRNLSTTSTVSFAARLTFTTGAGPNSVAAGDIDGDGKPEIISGNVSSSNISIFKNNSTAGTISLSPKLDITTGNGPYDVTIGDIDGDGKPDIATANFFASTVSLLKNLSTPGSISLQAKVDFATGTLPRCVSICDYDGDGRPDLVSSNSTANTISFLKNKMTPIPLQLVSLTAKNISNRSLINWQTAAEQNTSHFIVQHSADGIHFSDIGRVEAAGNSNTQLNYRFVHERPVTGINYYRLQLYDLDLSYKTTPVVRTVVAKDLQLSLSANPSRNAVTLYHPVAEKADIIITDMAGRKIMSMTASSNSSQTLVGLSALSPGSYVIEWKDKANSISTKLVVY